jgi:hypothetical protein
VQFSGKNDAHASRGFAASMNVPHVLKNKKGVLADAF